MTRLQLTALGVLIAALATALMLAVLLAAPTTSRAMGAPASVPMVGTALWCDADGVCTES